MHHATSMRQWDAANPLLYPSAGLRYTEGLRLGPTMLAHRSVFLFTPRVFRRAMAPTLRVMAMPITHERLVEYMPIRSA